MFLQVDHIFINLDKVESVNFVYVGEEDTPTLHLQFPNRTSKSFELTQDQFLWGQKSFEELEQIKIRTVKFEQDFLPNKQKK